ncbi:hypothetical protein NIES2104_04880 [Leptolyngbya sp. NIES-2104]|nr:hypothetical protein NIES2104_04880 [Leptolyngbya sp. NIES-2104]
MRLNTKDNHSENNFVRFVLVDIVTVRSHLRVGASRYPN